MQLGVDGVLEALYQVQPAFLPLFNININITRNRKRKQDHNGLDRSASWPLDQGFKVWSGLKVSSSQGVKVSGSQGLKEKGEDTP